MKKLNHKNRHDVQAGAGLRALRLQELLFGGGASAPVDPTGGTPLGTSLQIAAGSNGIKYPDNGGE
jgi:hypothetical protein